MSPVGEFKKPGSATAAAPSSSIIAMPRALSTRSRPSRCSKPWGAALPHVFPQGLRLIAAGRAVSQSRDRHQRLGEEPRGQPFSDRYVFPDGELASIGYTLKTAEAARLEVRDVESLREHYELTLRNWVRRLEEHADEAKKLTDEATYRVWRLYMAGAADGVRSSRGNLFQVLFVKPDAGVSGLPLRRTDWYE